MTELELAQVRNRMLATAVGRQFESLYLVLPPSSRSPLLPFVLYPYLASDAAARHASPLACW